jgi:dGTPase
MTVYERFSQTLGRPNSDEEEHSSRSPVAKDRDRVIHSGALRRLQRKSQIVGVQSNDFFRTRLTHTLECAQIGRGIALRSLESTNLGEVVEDASHLPDLLEAACYAHDLGHPPFGHNGERALRKLMARHGRGMFEANAQSFRIVTQLEPKVSVGDRWLGLDLTRATLRAIMKYPKTEWEAEAVTETKFCVYNEPHDLEVYSWLFDGTAPHRTVATEILDASDDIAYAVHDFEDGVWAGMIPLFRLLDESDRGARDELAHYLCRTESDLFENEGRVDKTLSALLAIPPEAPWAHTPFDRSLKSSAALKDFSAHLIGDFISEVTPDETFAPPVGDTRRRLEMLKGMERIWMIDHHERETLRYGQRRLVSDLFEGYWEQPTMLPLRSAWLEVAEPEKEDYDASNAKPGSDSGALRVWRAKARLICDHVAGMTDLFALHAHAEMFGGGGAPNLRLVGREGG